MAVTKAKKISQVESLTLELKGVSNGFIAEYGKLTVAQDDELRRSIRGAGAKYRVVKNTLAQRATVGTAFSFASNSRMRLAFMPKSLRPTRDLERGSVRRTF